MSEHYNFLASQKRLSAEEGLELLVRRPLDELMQLAMRRRLQLYPEAEVSYVLDTNPNYTNICVTQCKFCAFWKGEKDEHAYLRSADELVLELAPAVAAGVTTVLLQGGHLPHLTISYWLELIRAIQQAYPKLHIHPFSPPEIIHLARCEKMTVAEVVAILWEEGIRTLPGGGAEVLSERVRRILSPGKCRAEEWLMVMEMAHRQGMVSTATLVFGHIETPEEIIAHLLQLRSLQDRTGGFLSFIPWSFKFSNSQIMPEEAGQRHLGIEYLRILATARLMLDNIPHIQASWFGEGKKVGALGLLAGADDFGGILFAEKVLAETGHTPHIDIEEMRSLIASSGFTPVQRDSFYHRL